MMKTNIVDKAKGCLIGLAVGDALGVDTEGMSPSMINEKFGFVNEFISDEPAGSDDTEFAAFNSLLLIKHGKNLTSEIIAEAWLTEIVSQGETFKGAGFSEMMAMNNLKKGLRPPFSGMHAHNWSDGFAMRVAPFGIIFPGFPKDAVDFCFRDGIVTHSYEGIYSGQAVAAAIAAAMDNCNINQIFEAALNFIPKNSWTSRSIKKAISIGSKSNNLEEALKNLYENISCNYYHWADLGPEAVGLSFGIISATKGDFINSVLGGVNVGRDTDTIAGIAGAIIGAKIGYNKIPAKWSGRINNCKGKCIHTVKDVNLSDLAEKLVNLI